MLEQALHVLRIAEWRRLKKVLKNNSLNKKLQFNFKTISYAFRILTTQSIQIAINFLLILIRIE